MQFTRLFNQISKDDISLAGGKGASLGEMSQAGLPVPPGFVILSPAFNSGVLESTSLKNSINSILRTVNLDQHHTIENVSAKIQNLIINIDLPLDLITQVKEQFKILGAEHVAVRSSATIEDGSSEAWAGQLETYLNTTEDNLIKNIKKCWASLYTPRAIFYRFEKKLQHQHISVAVVIQQMIPSQLAGVAFSVHPISEDHNQLIIEAGYGLGEAIVSGAITPDSYVVTKEPRRIVARNINIQKTMIVLAYQNGTQWVDIPKVKGEKSVLDGQQILKLSKLVIKIERHYAFPVDIEWAFYNDKFYILQSRPITTLSTEAIKPEKMAANSTSPPAAL